MQNVLLILTFHFVFKDASLASSYNLIIQRLKSNSTKDEIEPDMSNSENSEDSKLEIDEIYPNIISLVNSNVY